MGYNSASAHNYCFYNSFCNIAGLDTNGIPPFLFYLCGSVAWSLFFNLFYRHRKHLCQQCVHIWQGLFPEDSYSHFGSPDKPDFFYYSICLFCRFPYFLLHKTFFGNFAELRIYDFASRNPASDGSAGARLRNYRFFGDNKIP
jgi:hypothetical protein